MKKILFTLLLAHCAYAGQSGVFVGGSLSLNNTFYQGLYSVQENGATTEYPHSNYSPNALGLSLRVGYQKFSSDAKLGARIYLEYNNNGYGSYKDELGRTYKMDMSGFDVGADLLFEVLQLESATFGIFAGGAVGFNSHKFTNAQYSIYQSTLTTPAKLEGYGLNAHSGVSLTFKGNHRIELELQYANFVSDYDSGIIRSADKAESLKLEAQGFLKYRLNYFYVF